MINKRADIDIVSDVLEECIIAFPVSSFIISLYKQYQQRGSLSKKQLQGLHSKASKIENIVPAKLATLEAIIKKMRTKDKSELPANKPMFEKDKNVEALITTILAKNPQHKRVLFLKSKFDNNEKLSLIEMAELNKFNQLLK